MDIFVIKILLKDHVTILGKRINTISGEEKILV